MKLGMRVIWAIPIIASILIFTLVLSQNTEALKSEGNSLTEVSSKKVCGTSLCDEPMSIAEKIRLYLQKLSGSESTVLQQGIDPRLMDPLKVKPGTMPSREALSVKQPEQLIPQGEQFYAPEGTDLKEMLSPFTNNLSELREMVANAPDRDNYSSDADFQKATDDFDNELDSKFSQFHYNLEEMSTSTDINAIVQWVLREAYMENMETMRDYADKVKFFNEMKKDLRDKLTEARNVASDYQQYDTTSGEEIYPDEYGRIKVKFPWILEELDYDPSKPVVLKGVASSDSYGVLIINKNDESGRHLLKILEIQLQDEIAKAEADRETLRNDRQMTSTQFENANQKATQYINMLSSVLKTMQEMNKGIIQNLR